MGLGFVYGFGFGLQFRVFVRGYLARKASRGTTVLWSKPLLPPTGVFTPGSQRRRVSGMLRQAARQSFHSDKGSPRQGFARPAP